VAQRRELGDGLGLEPAPGQVGGGLEAARSQLFARQVPVAGAEVGRLLHARAQLGQVAVAVPAGAADLGEVEARAPLVGIGGELITVERLRLDAVAARFADAPEVVMRGAEAWLQGEALAHQRSPPAARSPRVKATTPSPL
jgi:hypothetical protein